MYYRICFIYSVLQLYQKPVSFRDVSKEDDSTATNRIDSSSSNKKSILYFITIYAIHAYIFLNYPLFSVINMTRKSKNWFTYNEERRRRRRRISVESMNILLTEAVVNDERKYLKEKFLLVSSR
jgi:hypothetical protein